MCKKPMCSRIFGSIVVLAALVLAFLVMNVSIDNVDHVMMVIKFFDVMIPVLAVGALIKYVFKSKGCCKGCNCSSCGGTDQQCNTK